MFAEKLREQILQPVPHRHDTFSIPKVLRGLFERERRLLSLLSQTAYESIRKSFQQLLHRKDVQPGAVASLQTFGSFAAHFNPHCHGLVTEGAFTPQGEFLLLPTPTTYLLADIEERFRQLLLSRLHRAERLSEAFMSTLLRWSHSGSLEGVRMRTIPNRGQHLTRNYGAYANRNRSALSQNALTTGFPPWPETTTDK